MYNTTKKQVLIDLFGQNQDSYYSAKDITNKLADKMDKATIYRQLQRLENENYIRKTYNDKTGSYEYQYSNDCDSHFHLKCSSCGRIIHLRCSDANVFTAHILDTHGFKISQNNTTLYGLCKECSGC